jgi:hypothetical protein
MNTIPVSLYLYLLGPLTDLKWDNYLRDCGAIPFSMNKFKTMKEFERTYSGKGITWDGYIIRVN